MLDQYYVDINPQGEAAFYQIDWESSPITVWFENDTHIVFKIPAGRHWESIINNSVPHPGKYLVCEIDSVVRRPESPKGDRRLLVKELFQMPISNRGRQ